MRPFYLKADVDVRKTPLAGGPARNDGEMEIELHQKNDGVSDLAFRITCRAYENELVTTVYDSKGRFVADYRTPR